MDAEPVVRRRRPVATPTESSGTGPAKGKRPARSKGAPKGRGPAKGKGAPKDKGAPKGRASARGTGPSKDKRPAKASRSARDVAAQKKSPPRSDGAAGHLVRPSTAGPKVRLGMLWFIVAVASVIAGRWAVMALWGAVAAAGAWQVSRVWMGVPRARDLPDWTPHLSAVAAVLLSVTAALGTSLAGIALIVVPLAIVGVFMASGRSPAAAGAAVIATVLASVPAVSVILVARIEPWSAMFLVIAVSFYDAGYFIGAAESSSRLEGPITGGIGLLAVTFAASAVEAQPFDRATAWVAGVTILFACPLGQMLTSAELPRPDDDVPAMRRLDAYLVAAPLMLGAVWTFG